MHGGSVYAKGATYKIRRHVWQKDQNVASKKARIFPLLSYETSAAGATTVSTYDKEALTVYATPQVESGSVVRKLNLDMLVQPATSDAKDQIIDFYVGRIILSFHDIDSGEVRGLVKESTGQIAMTNVASNDVTQTSQSKSQVSSLVGPEIDWDYTKFQQSYKLKHWWRGVRKTTLPAGMPASYRRWEYVPRKCRRSQEGMFYGIIVMNDSGQDLNVDLKVRFNEFPLVDT